MSRSGEASVLGDDRVRAVESVMKADEKGAGSQGFAHCDLIGRRMGEERVVQTSVVGKPIFEARKPIVPEHHVDAGAERPAAARDRDALAVRRGAR